MVETGIAVMGTGEVRGRPDTAALQVGVSVERPSVAEATRDAAAAARALTDALLGAGVAERDIQTGNLAVSPTYEYPPNRQPKLTGYTFTNTLSIVLRDVDAIGEVVDRALTAAGDAAVLHGITFALSDPSAALAEARAAAFVDARARAEQLAALAGVELGAALAIEEIPAGDGPQPRMFRMAAAEAAPPVAAGEVSTSVAVTVRFAIG